MIRATLRKVAEETNDQDLARQLLRPNGMNDSDVTHFLFMGERPANLEVLSEQWEKNVRNSNEVTFAIIDKKNDRSIGWGGLYVINWSSRTAEYRVFIGANSVLVGPITIGDDVLIGAGLVVSESISANSVVHAAKPVIEPRKETRAADAEEIAR